MAKGYNATEYMYSSARIRSMETRIATAEQIARLAEAENADAVLNALGEYGFEAVYANGKLSREDTLLGVLKRGFRDVGEMECGEAVHFLKYQYDCNNIKALIKCGAAGISPDGMLLPLGSIDIEDVKKAYLEKDYSVFPDNMALAIAEAESAFAATANPQKVDFIIDRATFADMLKSAKDSGVPLAQRLVTVKIDLVNIMIAIRLIRMRLGAQAEALLDEAYVDGGSLDRESLCEAVTAGEDGLSELLAYSSYSTLAEHISAGATLGRLEKAADDMWVAVAKEARYAPFGAEVAIGYIFALEYEVKNIRIVLAGKEAGLSSDIIRERMRECYV